MIRGIHHVAINTPNFDRLLAFYRDVVGFEVVESSQVAWDASPEIDGLVNLKGTAARVVMIRAANAYIELFEYRKPTARNTDRLLPSDHGYTHICLDVVDLASEYERLSKNGMTFHAPPISVEEGRIRTIYGKDPDGNVIELQELSPSLDMAVENLTGFKLG
ncbi:VOC family protein [Phenylobacterium sp. LjRoot225]|uniref:VOC family protein n=1 Tax=Phenylobacterium sp. LjRoot225 TaxID=3342285 RepID=UPI003ECF1DD2